MANLRMKIHDDVGIPLVIDRLREFGFQCHKMGTETDSRALYEALVALDDQPALMLRFRPDLIATHQEVRTILCEVKCELADHNNFAIEADSYRAARIWNGACRRVVYIFVDLVESENGDWDTVWKGRRFSFNCIDVSSCWADEIIEPRSILIPERWDFNEQYDRMGQEWPNARRVPIQYKKGSGTPFFTLSKSATFLNPFNIFAGQLIDNGDVSDAQLEPLPNQPIQLAF